MKLKPFSSSRPKRWDSIGKTWKWIAGTPDADDLKMINTSINSLVLQNNQQVLINEEIGKRIQDITAITNQVLKAEKERTKNRSLEFNQLIMLSNLDSLQDQVETLEEAVLMAKHGIPCSKLLTIHNFNNIATYLAKYDMFISSFEELLSKAKAQVMMNTTHIHYILKIPQLSINTYEHIYVDSIIKNDKRISIKQNYYLRNLSHIYELKHSCSNEAEYFLCENQDIDIPPHCIKELIFGQHTNCTFERVYSKGLIKRITDATILINDAVIEITSNCSNNNHILNGSFLIQFEQCNLRINGELYSNYEMTLPNNPYHPTTGLLVNEIGIIDSPTPEYLTNLTLSHRAKMDFIELQNQSLEWKFNLFGSFTGTLVTITIIYFAIRLVLSRRNSLQINIKPEKIDETALTEISTEPESSTKQLSEEKQNEIEKFLNVSTPYRNI
ncbi:uncharacterized protein LOC129756044 [Uranotaenia lowii]|uniref:uncharacterized protein LOC129756044 n=1 Tax=Uranotaenia lowii TaxID=190385 RepID=UPI00247A74D9|nr:uncharacterized protein LOC129756044 [Uranotaenia lowii]XP_055608773.1 uncharacterized protein LOC129756044 [Uranotaenia lowii]